jgi:hypothetical protein
MTRHYSRPSGQNRCIAVLCDALDSGGERINGVDEQNRRKTKSNTALVLPYRLEVSAPDRTSCLNEEPLLKRRYRVLSDSLAPHIFGGIK